MFLEAEPLALSSFCLLLCLPNFSQHFTLLIFLVSEKARLMCLALFAIACVFPNAR